MIQFPSKADIERNQNSPYWDFGNSILYDLCRNNFEHKKDEIIIAKVWLIGRSYAAAIERRRNKEKSSDDFYIDVVLPTIRESELDLKLTSLRSLGIIMPSNAPEVLRVHKYLTNLLRGITSLDKRSFSSKYLHFHLPELFFLYDSRASSAVGGFVEQVPEDLRFLSESKDVDNQYAKFTCKCIELSRRITKTYGVHLTPRQLDNLLLETANRKNKT